MKILFWNIGKELTSGKIDILKELVLSESPNICCLAEGSNSQKDCQKIEELYSSLNYQQFYTPILGKVNFQLPYARNGLKVFHKDCQAMNDFEFHHQRQDGRIIRFDFSLNGEVNTVIFLHNYSKNGGIDSTRKQLVFISDIKRLLDNSQLNLKDSNVVVLGDFNLEPWDNNLRTPDLLNSYFMTKHLSWAENIKLNRSVFYTPSAEEIIQNKESIIGGTYFSEKYGWALFDFPIYNKRKMKLNFKILNTIGEKTFFKTNGANCEDFKESGFDHLPILVTL